MEGRLIFKKEEEVRRHGRRKETANYTRVCTWQAGDTGSCDSLSGAIGIFTITPSEAAIIAADVASKAADIEIGFVDRFNGSLIISGDVAGVEAALNDVMSVLCDSMGFTPAPITRS